MPYLEVAPSSLPGAGPVGFQSTWPEEGPASTKIVFFVVDDDPVTGQPWCPDVRAALPVVRRLAEESDAAEVAVVSVGSRQQWKDPGCIWRTKWELKAVPTLAKYSLVEGIVQREVLVEEECKDEEKVRSFLQ